MDTSTCPQIYEAGQTPSVILSNVHAELKARILSHPFLARCDKGQVTFDELRNFLVQHGEYSSYFTRYLCAVISQLDDGEDATRLAENLAEELGYGLDNRVPHSRIYARTLEEFGLESRSNPIHPETQFLIDTMFSLCRQSGGIAGLGALYLGAESIVPEMYTCIMKGFRAHAVPRSALKFFTIHVSCDDEHAQTMRAIIERMVADARAGEMALMRRVLSAGETAICARLRFFDGLAGQAQ